MIRLFITYSDGEINRQCYFNLVSDSEAKF